MPDLEQTAVTSLASALERLRDAGADVCESAFVHPLGFIVYPLVRDTIARLRLHVWQEVDRYTQSPDWPIHNHRFVLRSHILFGELTNNMYRVSDDANGCHRLYHVEYQDNRSVMLCTDQRVSVVLEARDKHHAGDTYTIPREQFHSTIVEMGTFAATLVSVYDEAPIAPLVIGDPNCSRLEYERSKLDVSDALQLLRRVQSTVAIR